MTPPLSHLSLQDLVSNLTAIADYRAADHHIALTSQQKLIFAPDSQKDFIFHFTDANSPDTLKAVRRLYLDILSAIRDIYITNSANPNYDWLFNIADIIHTAALAAANIDKAVPIEPSIIYSKEYRKLRNFYIRNILPRLNETWQMSPAIAFCADYDYELHAFTPKIDTAKVILENRGENPTIIKKWDNQRAYGIALQIYNALQPIDNTKAATLKHQLNNILMALMLAIKTKNRRSLLKNI